MSNQVPHRERMSMREGGLYVDGRKVLDVVKASFKWTPEVMQTRSVGQHGKCSRYVGYELKGSIEEYKSTPWTKNMIQKYMNTGETQRFTLQGTADDKNSDYYKANGIDRYTLTEVVFTGDISLLELDAEDKNGAKNVLQFSAYDVQI